ncbi:MAG: GH3 auxin-responsive promoter family protein [Dysgonamonadaceae bacterium]
MIETFINKYLIFRYRKIDKFLHKPFQTQENVLSYLLKNGTDTYFGQEHHFGNIRHADDFRKYVPVSRYENLRPYLDKIILEKGKNILWNSPVKWFAMSSGTTEDKSKYIPVTEESLRQCHYECGEQMLSIYAKHHPKSKFLLGKTLIIGGSKQINNIGEGIFTGDISAILIKNLYYWAKQKRTPEDIALLTDWEEKLEALTKFAMKSDIRALMGVPSWMLILLKKIREESGKSLNELWPDFEVFFHGGVNFAPYQGQYNELIGNPDIEYWETYNASEGFFGVQYDSTSKDMLLMLNSGIYYEFMPMDQWDKEHPETLTLEEVKPHENYAMIISTNGGLWRYMLGDTIEFTSVDPFLFRVTGRTKSFINAFGEELIIDNAEKAIEQACRETGATISDYTAAPVYFQENKGGAHEWLIEFEKQPSDIDNFTVKLDQALQSVNSDYEAKRAHNISLQMPIIRTLPKGTFVSWMESQNKLGGQNKVPKLANHRNYIEKILTYIERNHK